MKRNLNILVTGSKGQLGTSLKRSVSRSASESNDNYIFTDVEELDITDRNAVMKFIKDNDIDVTVNCAAYTNVDKAEEEPELAELLNAKAVRNLADGMRENNGFLIHVSTDYVFGGHGKNTPLTETEPAAPTGIYGLTKLHGEEEIKASGVKSIILRTSWLYSETGKNFVKTILSLTSEKPELKVVFDQCGTPTYAGDLADAIFDILENRKMESNQGIYHYSNEGVCSWFDFAKVIAEMASHKDCDIRPCHSDEFPSKVKRPSYSVLDKTKFKETFGLRIPYWTDSLRKCISNLSGN